LSASRSRRNLRVVAEDQPARGGGGQHGDNARRTAQHGESRGPSTRQPSGIGSSCLRLRLGQQQRRLPVLQSRCGGLAAHRHAATNCSCAAHLCLSVQHGRTSAQLQLLCRGKILCSGSSVSYQRSIGSRHARCKRLRQLSSSDCRTCNGDNLEVVSERGNAGSEQLGSAGCLVRLADHDLQAIAEQRRGLTDSPVHLAEGFINCRCLPLQCPDNLFGRQLACLAKLPELAHWNVQAFRDLLSKCRRTLKYRVQLFATQSPRRKCLTQLY